MHGPGLNIVIYERTENINNYVLYRWPHAERVLWHYGAFLIVFLKEKQTKRYIF